MFRNSKTYTELLADFDDAVEKIWPEYLEGPCKGISHEQADLEELVITSYRLMKCIRAWLKKKKHEYSECNTFPNLYTALEEVVDASIRHRALAHEASKLEAVSRAGYHWMKTYKMLGRTPTKKELDHKPKRSLGHCYICKTEAETDDGICEECGGDITPPLDSTPDKGKATTITVDYPGLHKHPFDEMGYPLAQDMGWGEVEGMMFPASRFGKVR